MLAWSEVVAIGCRGSEFWICVKGKNEKDLPKFGCGI